MSEEGKIYKLSDYKINHEAYWEMLVCIDLYIDYGTNWLDYKRQDAIEAMTILAEKYNIYPTSNEIIRIWEIYSENLDTGWLMHQPDELVNLVLGLVILYGQDNSIDTISDTAAVYNAMKIKIEY